MKDRDRGPSPDRTGLFWRLSAGARAGRPRGILRVWPLWERLARRIWPTVPVPGAPHGLFAVHLTHHRGEAVTLPDGTVIREGDRIAELHANGSAVARVTAVRLWDLYAASQADLRAIAAWIQDPALEPEVKALYAVTVLGPGTKLLGFTVRERPITIRARLDRFFLNGLLALYSQQGIQRLARGSTPRSYPQESWMSRAELLRRYGGEQDTR